MSSAQSQQGFTLIEIAMVLMIIALVLGGLLPTISGQIEQRRISETRKQLEEIKDALLGYAIANGHFPCPAKSPSDGAENRSGGVCNQRQGFIPWMELGVAKLDAWGRIIRYSATPAYTNSVTEFKIGQARDITISTRDSTDALINLSNANDIPVVVMSHGKNGYGATLDNGASIANDSSNNPDEQTNSKTSGSGAGTNFVTRDQSTRTTTGTSGEFDDLVTWISPNTLFGKMVAAGKLP